MKLTITKAGIPPSWSGDWYQIVDRAAAEKIHTALRLAGARVKHHEAHEPLLLMGGIRDYPDGPADYSPLMTFYTRPQRGIWIIHRSRIKQVFDLEFEYDTQEK